MDMTNEVFSLARLRELDLVHLLDMYDHAPTARKKNDTDYWYRSPLREERTASFHIDRLSNEWYDFGLAAGGNPLDFLLRFHNCSISELLERMNVSFSPHQLYLHEPDLHEGRVGTDSKLIVSEVRPLYAYPLKSYLHERQILFAKKLSIRLVAGITMGSVFKMTRAAGRSATKTSSKAVRRRISPVSVRATVQCMFLRGSWTFFLMPLCIRTRTRNLWISWC
jgi:hypothetical protein